MSTKTPRLEYRTFMQRYDKFLHTTFPVRASALCWVSVVKETCMAAHSTVSNKLNKQISRIRVSNIEPDMKNKNNNTLASSLLCKIRYSLARYDG